MCCLFGLIDYHHTLNGREKSKILSVLSVACESRGTDATGIAYNSGGRLHIYKRPAAAHKLRLIIPDEASVIMGHTRMATQGRETKNYNNHPFFGKAGGQEFALAHNGVLHNDRRLRQEKHLPPTKIQTDSYIAVQLLEEKEALDPDCLKYMAEQVEGSFAFTVLDGENQLYFVKGDNPLCVYHYAKTGLMLYASTEEILTGALNKLKLPLEKPWKVEISCGDILKVAPNGNMSVTAFNTDNLFRSWYDSFCMPFNFIRHEPLPARADAENLYVEELKSVAGAFGYTPQEVDLLLEEGFSPEELEDYFYGGER